MAVKRIGLQERFQGALVGAVVGDCLGAPFEFDTRTNGIPMDKILKKINPLSKLCQNSKTIFEYTGKRRISFLLVSILFCFLKNTRN